MPTKQFYATGAFKHPGYPTRMLKAGDPVTMDGPTARLFRALGKITNEPPRAAASSTPEVIDAEAVPPPIKARRKRRAK